MFPMCCGNVVCVSVCVACQRSVTSVCRCRATRRAQSAASTARPHSPVCVSLAGRAYAVRRVGTTLLPVCDLHHSAQHRDPLHVYCFMNICSMTCWPMPMVVWLHLKVSETIWQSTVCIVLFEYCVHDGIGWLTRLLHCDWLIDVCCNVIGWDRYRRMLGSWFPGRVWPEVLQLPWQFPLHVWGWLLHPRQDPLQWYEMDWATHWHWLQ